MDVQSQNVSSIPTDAISNMKITSVWTFLLSIQWSESWLIGLCLFHGLCFSVTLLTLRFYRAQICHFLLMVGMVYSAEYINELAAANWRSFSRYQYFDSRGMFISLVFSVPLLSNTMLIVMVWVYRTFASATELKSLQLKRRAATAKENQTEDQVSRTSVPATTVQLCTCVPVTPVQLHTCT